jgi:ribonuclease HI
MRIRSGLYYRYAKEAANLRKQLPDLVIQWIPREQNREADYLARQAMPKVAQKKRNAELARLIREQYADQKQSKKRTW